MTPQEWGEKAVKQVLDGKFQPVMQSELDKIHAYAEAESKTGLAPLRAYEICKCKLSQLPLPDGEYENQVRQIREILHL